MLGYFNIDQLNNMVEKNEKFLTDDEKRLLIAIALLTEEGLGCLCGKQKSELLQLGMMKDQRFSSEQRRQFYHWGILYSNDAAPPKDLREQQMEIFDKSMTCNLEEDEKQWIIAIGSINPKSKKLLKSDEAILIKIAKDYIKSLDVQNILLILRDLQDIQTKEDKKVVDEELRNKGILYSSGYGNILD